MKPTEYQALRNDVITTEQLEWMRQDLMVGVAAPTKAGLTREVLVKFRNPQDVLSLSPDEIKMDECVGRRVVVTSREIMDHGKVQFRWVLNINQVIL